jgi:hypothetical protein
VPSPLGHALAAVAAGHALAGPTAGQRSGPRALLRQALVFGALGVLPDVDLVFGAHSGPTHGVGAALAVGLIALGLTRRGRFAAAAAAAYGSHTLLDWLGSDSSVPIGIMALWPFSSAHYESNLHVFHAISRRYWLPGFFEQNARAVLREVLILVPPTLLVLAWRAPTRRDRGSRIRVPNPEPRIPDPDR